MPSTLENIRYSASHTIPPRTISRGVHEAWVNHFRTSEAPGVDYAAAIALDAAGNVYVTGSSQNAPYDEDYLTAKYNPNGVLLWTARYNGEGNGPDHAVALDVDANGDAYVFGSSQGIDEATDLVTIKYNSAGTQQWIVRYDDPNNAWINATAMVLDEAGHAHVTGWTSGVASEIVTVKYNSDGVELWQARSNKDRFSIPNALTVDSRGNVYVAGSSGDAGGRRDFLTVKYNVNGDEQWAASFDDQDDNVSAIAVDGDGSIYVMGESRGASGRYVIIKYNQAGVLERVMYLEPGINRSVASSALTTDGAGNVYVAAAGVDGHDYAVYKFGSNGTTLWAAYYDSPGEPRSDIVDLALDPTGNVLVTGTTAGIDSEQDFTTIKYGPDGEQQWAARYNGTMNSYDYVSAIVIDQAGRVLVAGSSYEQLTGQDYTTIQYDANGQEQWVTHYNNEENSNDAPQAMTIDAAGNVYVAGSSELGDTGFDFITIKYNNDGAREWTARYDGPAHGNDAAHAIRLDEKGNIYVFGSSLGHYGAKSHLDFLTIKYDAAGTPQWAARYNAPGYSSDQPITMRLDEAGNVYVTGRSLSLRDDDVIISETCVTVKYNAEGVEERVISYLDLDEHVQYPTAIAVDASANVFIAGLNSSGLATIKYDTEGKRQWATHDDSHLPLGIELDTEGNVYIVGSNYQAGGLTPTYSVIKYDANGKRQWRSHSEILKNSYSRPTAFARDLSGNIYVSGLSFHEPESYGFATVKFNSLGIEQWAVRHNSPGGYSQPKALTADGAGNAYVTGWHAGGGTNLDFSTIKYNTDGVEQWVARYNSPENAYDMPEAIAVDNWGTVYVTGRIGGGQSGYITTIKYTQDDLLNAPRNFDLSQSFPNPFTAVTNIRFRLQNPSLISLKVYNLVGQEIETLVNGFRSAGEYRFQWNPVNLPNGVYLYRLQAGDFVETKKLIFLRKI